MSLNKAFFIGRLTRDVEVKMVGEGVMVANYAIAVQRKYKGKDGKPLVDYIDITAWRNKAEFAQKYFCKGKQVWVLGEIETYTHEKENVKIKGFNLKVDEQGFADTKSGGNNTDNQGGTAEQPQNGDMSPVPDDFGSMPDDFAPVPGDFDDDLPFN